MCCYKSQATASPWSWLKSAKSSCSFADKGSHSGNWHSSSVYSSKYRESNGESSCQTTQAQFQVMKWDTFRSNRSKK